MLRLYALAAAVLIGAGGVWYVLGAISERNELRDTVAAQSRELATKDREIAQRKQAQVVLADNLAKQTARAREYDRFRATLEGVENAPLPEWFLAYLSSLGLRANNPR